MGCQSSSHARQFNINPLPILGQSDVNPMSYQSQWGCQARIPGVYIHCQSSAIQCQSKKPILFQSKPNRPPIMHIFGTNPLTSYTNFILIYCQSNVHQVQIHHQSDANPVSINPLPIIRQSSDIPVQIYCQAITNVVLLVHCKPISIKC